MDTASDGWKTWKFYIQREKGKRKDTLEKYYIFSETKLNNQMNDAVTIKQDSTFDTTDHYDHYSRLPNAYTPRLTTTSFSRIRSSSLLFTVIQAVKQPTSGLAPPPPRSTRKINTTSGNNLLTRIQDNQFNPSTIISKEKKQTILPSKKFRQSVNLLDPRYLLQSSTLANWAARTRHITIKH